ncbi:transposase [Caballeronia pedi]|uniref:transposase n=1 Tax=Caballeronia pedi TaxID=1777141 RepID=UPI000B356177
MTLDTGESIRRFVLHVSADGFNRIRHYGLLANPVRRANLAKFARSLALRPNSAPHRTKRPSLVNRPSSVGTVAHG